MRTGLFGGSFNPIHKGHTALGETVMDKLSLDRIIFIPSGHPPHKSDSEYAPPQDRLEMCRLATEYNDRFFVSSFETEREGKSYSIYTVEHFRQLYPDDELFLLVGSDMLLTFDKWYRYEDILKQVTLTAVTRTGEDKKQLTETAQRLGTLGKIIVAEHQPLIISSTNLRKMIKNNEDLSCYLEKKVVKYIMARNLYGEKK